MRSFADPAAIAAAVGESIGPSSWVLIDQPRVDQFADATGDHQWIHVDPERAQSSVFGATIAHGYLTLSLIPVFSAELFEIKNVSSRLNYGLNSVRFPHPVRVGSRLRASATIVSVEPVAAGVQVITRYVVEIEEVTKPACVAEAIGLLLP